MFENKDKDLDGRLSFEEFMGEESRAERLFKLMDKDNDGWVTKHVSSHQSVPGCWSHNVYEREIYKNRRMGCQYNWFLLKSFL